MFKLFILYVLIHLYSKNETAIGVLRPVLEELEELTKNGMTKEELDRAKFLHWSLSIEHGDTRPDSIKNFRSGILLFA